MANRKLLGKLESSWAIQELKNFLTYYRVPEHVIVGVAADKSKLVELVRQTERDESISIKERLSATKLIQRDVTRRCPPSRITSNRYHKKAMAKTTVKPKPMQSTTQKSAEHIAHGPAKESSSTFHQPRLPNETLEEDEREFMSRHYLYGGRDQRLGLDDEVYAINRPQPNFNLEPISSFSDYRTSLFREDGRAPKDMATLRMSWGGGLGGKCYFSESGIEYTNHGRGPVWGGWTASSKMISAKADSLPDPNVIGKHVVANSCGVDCLIVAGIFLDIGQTIADRGASSRSDWLNKLTPIQKEYIEAVRTDWNDYTAVGSVKKKNRFYNAVLAALGFEYTQFTPPAGVWTGQLASSFHQFTFHIAVQKSCAKCGLTSIRGDPGGQITLTIDVDFDVVQKNPNITLSHYLRYYFDHRAFQGKRMVSNEFHCGVPPSKTKRVVIGGMPPRLVVTPENRDGKAVPLPEHTKKDISFRYEDETGNERSAIYRWIGGIYLANRHYRVYWDDSEFEDGVVKVYDGQQPFFLGQSLRAGLLGTIIGGLSPPLTAERVPPPWCQAPCLLFYERVDNSPDGEELDAIQAIISKLKKATTNEITAEPGSQPPSLQEFLPIDTQIRKLAANSKRRYSTEIDQLKRRKANIRVRKKRQEEELMEEKEAAREAAMKEIKARTNLAPPPLRNPSLTSSRATVGPKMSHTALLQSALGRTLIPSQTGFKPTAPRPILQPPEREFLPPTPTKAMLNRGSAEAGEKRVRRTSDTEEAKDGKKQKIVKAAEGGQGG